MGRTEIRGGQIRDETIDSADLASGSIKAGELSAQAISGQVTITSTDTTSDRLLIWDATDSALKQAAPTNLFVESGTAVGIGTGTDGPDNTLHVKSPGTTHIKIESEAGYEAALKMNAGSSSTYVWTPGNTSDIRLYAGGADRMHIDNDGSVGIGTTGPDRKLDILDTSNPQLRLTQADGTKYVDIQANAAGDLEITGVSTDTDHSHLKFIATGNAAMIIQSQAADGDAQLGFSVDAGSSLAFSVGVDDGDSDKFKIGTSTIDTNTRLTITSAGNVGIGEDSPTSKFEINGSLATKVASKNADYTLGLSDFTILIDANNANRTLTLPAVSTTIGRIYVIKRTDQSGDTVTITRAGSDTIDGQATVTINGGDSITLQSAGHNSWIIIGEYRAPLP